MNYILIVVLVYFFARFTVYPFINLSSNISLRKSIKKRLAEFGQKYIKLTSSKKKQIGNVLIILLVIAIMCVYVLKFEDYLSLYVLFLFIPAFFNSFFYKITEKFNGVYENGIIFGENLLFWNEINSYSKKNKNKVKIITNDKNEIVLKSGGKADAIILIFDEKITEKTDETVEQTADSLVDTPVEQSVDTPAEQSVDKPVEQSLDTPAEQNDVESEDKKTENTIDENKTNDIQE